MGNLSVMLQQNLVLDIIQQKMLGQDTIKTLVSTTQQDIFPDNMHLPQHCEFITFL